MGKTELAVVEKFDLQTLSGTFAEAVAEEMAGLGTIPFDRIKMPSGGGIAFELPGEDDETPESATEIVGIILAHHPVNTYWNGVYTGERNQPDCSSLDGKQGVIRETGEKRTCENCPYNQFGSNGKTGKACKNIHRIFLIREGHPIPMILSLPPSSLKYVRDYIAKRILLKGLRCFEVVTKISIKREKSAAGILYSRAAFTFMGKLNEKDRKEAEVMRNYVKQQYRQIDFEEELVEERKGLQSLKTEEDGFFSIPNEEAEELPFR